MEQAKQKTEKKEENHSKATHTGTAVRSIIRIVGTDIPGHFTVYHGLTRIKGISWSFSNALCKVLAIDKKRSITSLTESEIEKIIKFLKQPKLMRFLLNRRFDIATGEDKHLFTTELDLQKEFDIRNMKKIRSYRGWRHAIGLPVRGQRTRSHFRKGRSVGVQHSKAKSSKK